MNNKLKLLCVVLCAYGLTSCTTYESKTVYRTYAYDDSGLYPQGFIEHSGSYYYDNQFRNLSSQAVNVPDSYHVGAYHSPVSFKDRDKTWVKNQNPQGYTIEVADDEKAAQVAKKLYQAPKGDRRAQVQYQDNGKSHYKGFYGSYDNEEAAKKAFNSLPADLKQGAGVKNWGSVQNSIQE
ncbi:MAG: SPOR domain-containing protein [Legionella sp.]|nr:MAG: SPOR domain-containing protein [Legionella sp.]